MDLFVVASAVKAFVIVVPFKLLSREQRNYPEVKSLRHVVCKLESIRVGVRLGGVFSGTSAVAHWNQHVPGCFELSIILRMYGSSSSLDPSLLNWSDFS